MFGKHRMPFHSFLRLHFPPLKKVTALLLLCLSITTSAKDNPRIISLAPSLTESLYAIQAEKFIVGVTRYCRFPEEATRITQVGGYYDPNYELIFALAPDVVVLLKEHEKTKQQLTLAKIPYIESDHQSIEGILKSIQQLGELTGQQASAQKLNNEITTTLNSIAPDTEHSTPAPKVLISIGRSRDSEVIQSFFAAGNDRFYNTLLNKAGAVNAYSGELAYPTISAEGLIDMEPDIIIDLIPSNNKNSIDTLKAQKQWQRLFSALPQQPAIHVLTEDYMVIPGPRISQVALKLAEIIQSARNSR